MKSTPNQTNRCICVEYQSRQVRTMWVCPIHGGKTNYSTPHIQQKEQKEKPYNETDHSHCWQSKKPPCGQRIEHLKCCLCEMLNPKTRTLLTEQKKAFVEMVEGEMMDISEMMKGCRDEEDKRTVAKYITERNHPLLKIYTKLKEI